MATPHLGFLTIGQSPRDDIVPEMVAQLPCEVQVTEAGAIDGLTLDEVRKLAPVGDEKWVVSRMQDGTEVYLAMRELIPLMQQAVNDLEAKGVDLIVPLCASDWSTLTCNVAFINPGGALQPIVLAMTRPGGKVGKIAPTQAQAEITAKKEADNAVPVVSTFAQPYAETHEATLQQCREAGKLMADADVDLIYMGCMGHTREMKAAVRETSGRPTVTANSIIASLISQAIA